MITHSNKKYTSTNKEVVPVEDMSISKGRLIEVPDKFYGKTEANPYNPLIKPKTLLSRRGDLPYLFQSKSFEYDFAETNRIIDTEALVASILRKKKALILRTDPLLRSKSERNSDYIQKRISEMEYVSGVLFLDLLESIVESLVNYNNVFILKHRSEFSSTGLFRQGKTPVSSLFVLSPTRISPIENENGDLIGYSYRNKRRNQEPLLIKKEDVYHIFTDKKIDVSVGTPPLEAVKDDIQSLRQLEESIENLVYKHSSPLIHVKVGDKEVPAGRLPDGTLEIDYYNNLVQNMDNEGGLTTSHRVDVSLIGAESHALRAEGTLAYFKQRVVSGLKASLLDLGEADSISTAGANAVSKILKQDVEAYQKLLERFFTNKLFNDLLLESKWYVDKARVPKEEEVELKLFHTDSDDLIKIESHMANLVRFGLLAPEAFSRETGRELPKISLTSSEISSNISTPNGTGAFSTITSPQNQHSMDKEYEVLDNLIKTDEDKRLAKIFFYVQDNLSDFLTEEKQITLSKKMDNIVSRYLKNNIDSKTISNILEDVIVKQVCLDLEQS